eukprot:6202753-Pleurochrysis_carterae.AAC.1
MDATRLKQQRKGHRFQGRGLHLINTEFTCVSHSTVRGPVRTLAQRARAVKVLSTQNVWNE